MRAVTGESTGRGVNMRAGNRIRWRIFTLKSNIERHVFGADINIDFHTSLSRVYSFTKVPPILISETTILCAEPLLPSQILSPFVLHRPKIVLTFFSFLKTIFSKLIWYAPLLRWKLPSATNKRDRRILSLKSFLYETFSQTLLRV